MLETLGDDFVEDFLGHFLHVNLLLAAKVSAFFTTLSQSLLFEGRRLPIKHENWSDAEKQQLEDPSEKSIDDSELIL